MKIEINNFVLAGVNSEIKKLYLSFLYLAEDLEKNGTINNDEFQRLRKRILDYGNNTLRNVTQQLESFDFNFKNN